MNVDDTRATTRCLRVSVVRAARLDTRKSLSGLIRKRERIAEYASSFIHGLLPNHPCLERARRGCGRREPVERARQELVVTTSNSVNRWFFRAANQNVADLWVVARGCLVVVESGFGQRLPVSTRLSTGEPTMGARAERARHKSAAQANRATRELTETRQSGRPKSASARARARQAAMRKSCAEDGAHDPDPATACSVLGARGQAAAGDPATRSVARWEDAGMARVVPGSAGPYRPLPVMLISENAEHARFGPPSSERSRLRDAEAEGGRPDAREASQKARVWMNQAAFRP